MISKTDVLILCGGLGKRLRSAVGPTQKTMADIDGRPFLDLQLKYLGRQGFQRVVLATGYQADDVEEYFSRACYDMNVVFSRESEPLGTGGAVLQAKETLMSDPFLVLNGDSFCDVDYPDLLDFHKAKGSLATMVLTRMDGNEDYGNVLIDEAKRIKQFQEKIPESSGDGWVSAGIYCFNREVFSLMPAEEKFSLEQDFFPQLTESDFFGFPHSKQFIDIGTPERYKKAQQILRKAE